MGAERHIHGLLSPSHSLALGQWDSGHQGHMRFRTKLLLILLPLVAFGQLLVADLIDDQATALIFKSSQAKAISIAAAAAAVIDGDAHAKLLVREDQVLPEYSSIRAQLKAIRDANRRNDTWVTFLYTVSPAKERPTALQYAVDPEEDLQSYSHLGDLVHGSNFANFDISKAGSFENFVTDDFGSWLTAFHPIKNSSGKAVGAVVVEIDRARILALSKAFVDTSYIALGSGIIIALLSSLLIARYVSRPLEKLEAGITEIGKGNFDAKIPIYTKDEFGSAADALREMAVGLRERARVKSAFARYVSHQVADAVLNSTGEVALTGERRRITVLFCDIRGFTTISEKFSPEKVVSILNDYFEEMVDIIFKHNGTLDKFMGDGLMAIFGAPNEDVYQEENAFKAALEMRERLHALSAKIQSAYGAEIKIGIGINSGVAIVGNMGSSKRMEYTAIGDTVNLASRLESRTKDEGVDLLLSEHTYSALRANFSDQLRRVGPFSVKGRKETITAYTPCDSPMAVSSASSALDPGPH